MGLSQLTRRATHPVKPRNLKIEDLTSTGAALKWNNQSDAKAYLVRWQADGSGEENQPIYYTEATSLAVDETLIGTKLAGIKFNLAVKALSKNYKGADALTIGQTALKAEPDDNWSYTSVEFPAAEK